MAIAVIGRIQEIRPIENADRLATAIVVCGPAGRWYGVVQKGQFEIDQLVEVYLQDALLPSEERFAFMERYKYIVKIQKLRGARSECLIMPLSTIVSLTIDAFNAIGRSPVGYDIEKLVKAQKYEKPIPATMSGDALGAFPSSLIPKTDEPNFQAVPEMVAMLEDKDIVITQKADGSSVTYYYNRPTDHFGVCSRNLELKEGNTVQWQLARKYNIEAALRSLPISAALQVEIVGPGIQGNPLGLKECDIRAFTLYDIDGRAYLDHADLDTFCGGYEIPQVTTLYTGHMGLDDEALLQFANAFTYPNGKAQEGIVVRPLKEMLTLTGERVSFKVINPEYK